MIIADFTFSDWISDAANWVFLAIAVAMIYAAFRVVTSSNVVHAVLFLVAALGGSAALFLLLGAEFVAWTVVLVYIGAVVVLFLFGIMITRAPLGTEPELDHARRWPAALTALVTFGVLTYVMVDYGDSIGAEDSQIPEGIGRTSDLGRVLFERFVIPFEVVSVLLLAALIGGIVLARRDPETEEDAP